MSTYNDKPLLNIPVTDASANAAISVGARQYKDGDEYVYVKYQGGATGAAEDVVEYAPEGDFSTRLYSSSEGIKPAGTLMATVANNQYCWIKAKGFARVKSAGSAVISGMNLAGSVTGAANGVTGSDKGKSFGFLYQSDNIPSGSATGMNAYINC